MEAGLGGRYDATSVIEADVAALTNVGLEHTRWLGPTVADIATEKLAAVRLGADLVLGAGCDEEVRSLAHRLADERQISGPERIAIAPEGPADGVVPAAAGTFQRLNFALAQAVAERHLAKQGVDLDAAAVRDAALHTTVAGRAQTIDTRPLTVLDGAHNPDAVNALVQALPELLGGRPVTLVMGVLEDKDAATMLRRSAASLRAGVLHGAAKREGAAPAALQSLARQLGFEEAECDPQPMRALQTAREWALARPHAAVLLTGSVYLVGEVLARAADLGLAAPSAAEGRKEAGR